jgi:hypothetical protein
VVRFTNSVITHVTRESQMSKLHAVVVISGVWLVAAAGVIAQEAAEPAPGPKYDLRIVRVGDTYQGFRFRPDTGESWQIVTLSWRKVAEADPLPAGKYDILLNVEGDNLLPIRVDHKTGHAWFLQARQWVQYDEAQPPAKQDEAKPDEKAADGAKGPAAKAKHYEFRKARVGANLHLIRLETKTGETWLLKGNGAFAPMIETGPVPPGDYDVTTVATEKSWMAFRIDRASGTSWMLRADVWVKIKEPAAD